jgi:hypothetical protein
MTSLITIGISFKYFIRNIPDYALSLFNSFDNRGNSNNASYCSLHLRHSGKRIFAEPAGRSHFTHHSDWSGRPRRGFGAFFIYGSEKKGKRREERLRILNGRLFKSWEKASISEEPFHIKILIEEEFPISYPLRKDIEPSSLPYFEDGKEFLNSESNRTREIWRIWKEIEGLKDKHNDIANETKKKIDDYFPKAYPSLECLESGKVSSQDCYIIDDIARFIWSLKGSLLENNRLNWGDIRLEEKFEENFRPPIWRLTGSYAGVLIQSKNQKDVDKERFKNIVEKLLLEISEELKQLNEFREKIVQSLENFRGKMDTLTKDIDLKKLD